MEKHPTLVERVLIAASKTKDDGVVVWTTSYFHDEGL